MTKRVPIIKPMWFEENDTEENRKAVNAALNAHIKDVSKTFKPKPQPQPQPRKRKARNQVRRVFGGGLPSLGKKR